MLSYYYYYMLLLFRINVVLLQVENMYVTEEWVYWSDESSHNLNAEGGLHPKVKRSKYSPVFTKLFYCYYQSKPRASFCVFSFNWSGVQFQYINVVGIFVD